MTKKDLILHVASLFNVVNPKKIKVIDTIINAALNSISTELARGGAVTLNGFGTFSTRVRKQCTARDPRTGCPTTVPTHNRPHFTASKTLSSLVRDNSDSVSTAKSNSATDLFYL